MHAIYRIDNKNFLKVICIVMWLGLNSNQTFIKYGVVLKFVVMNYFNYISCNELI